MLWSLWIFVSENLTDPCQAGCIVRQQSKETRERESGKKRAHELIAESKQAGANKNVKPRRVAENQQTDERTVAIASPILYKIRI